MLILENCLTFNIVYDILNKNKPERFTPPLELVRESGLIRQVRFRSLHPFLREVSGCGLSFVGTKMKEIEMIREMAMTRVVLALFEWLIKKNHHRVVYRLSSFFGRKGHRFPYRTCYQASWYIQSVLIETGYYKECSGCYWATDSHCCS